MQSVSNRSYGWIQFAGIMTIFTGLFNGFDGLVGLFRTRYFRNSFVFSDLRTWSWVLVGFGIVQLAAGFAILSGRTWGRWFGIITVAANALAQLLVIGSYPFWTFVILAYDVAILYALTAHWRRGVSVA
jgi:hypothetical protein